MTSGIKGIMRYREALSSVHAQRNRVKRCLDMSLPRAYNVELLKLKKMVSALKPIPVDGGEKGK